LSRFFSLPAIPSSFDEFRLNGSHIDILIIEVTDVVRRIGKKEVRIL
jgi:hypothetical protein